MHFQFIHLHIYIICIDVSMILYRDKLPKANISLIIYAFFHYENIKL